MSEKADVTRLKVSVAMAVLRNKPDGISGREYAKQLCSKMTAAQLCWKQRYKKASTEILHLKQQLALQKFSVSSEQDLASTQKSDDFLPPDSQPLFPTPPLSGSDHQNRIEPTLTSQCTESENTALIQHTKFLQHVISIQTGGQTLSSDSSFHSLIHDSLVHSLYLLQQQLGRHEYSWSVQRHCVQCIVPLLEKTSEDQTKTLLERIKDLCAVLISQIVSTDGCSIKQNEANVHRVQLLAEFATSHCLCPQLLTQLCECLHTYSSELRQVQRKAATFSPDKFCNIYYVIQACEKCLMRSGVGHLDQTVKEKIVAMLEDCILHLTQTYPLFAHGIWRLCALLQ